jgi:hypothetical protein
VQTDATRTCELLVGLRDVTVLGIDERLRQPDEVCVDVQHHLIHRPIAIPEGSGAPVRRRHQGGACPQGRSGAVREYIIRVPNIASVQYSMSAYRQLCSCTTAESGRHEFPRA